MPSAQQGPSSPDSSGFPPPKVERPLTLGDAPEELTPENMYTFLALSEVQQKAERDAYVERYGPDSERDWHWIIAHPLLWALVFLAVVLGIVLIGQAGDDGPTVPAAVTAGQDDDAPADNPSGTSGNENPTVTTTAAGLPKLLDGPWVAEDGQLGYQFAGDGTYLWSSLDGEGTGLYRLEADGDTQRLLFIDPSDPSGLTMLGQAEVRFDGDTMTLGSPGNETTFAHGALPVPGSATAPRVVLDVADAPREFGGMLRLALGPAAAPNGYPVSDTAAPLTATGTITMDAATNEVSGEIRVHYGCRPENCAGDGTDPSADLVITVTGSGPSTYQQMTFAMEGTATVQLTWTDGDRQADQVVPWSYNGTYAVTFTAGFDRGGAGVFSVVFYETPTDPATDADIGLQFSAVAPVSDVANEG